ncbi:GNAT family N-acetyltransferase [Massilia forsythiae]|uniref:GNAT family N-acetyltransferase n=1 Tax=Massilia forsythiae TaxID=2728020 RepID=A0A7Z2ZSA5_9BURK|nr:GNAT family N-acetyltransferase [Massilia forsythiae]QJE00099.1 GNAT family N-acetyltransferase [Massilia forsythiae]
MFAIGPLDPDHADAHVLLAELGRALAHITGSDGAASFDAADVRGERACFLVARGFDGNLAGCGALRPLDSATAELKRMYARPGSGAGTHLLAALEAQAVGFGYTQVWLETRRVNRRAVAFYERHGYRPIASYGKYMDRPEAVCLGKEVG